MKKTTFSPLGTVNMELWEKIRKIDYSLIMYRLMDKLGWSNDEAQFAISQYQQFLYINNIEGNVSPNEVIDEVWHEHVLHLQKYLVDCLVTFGKIIFHFPFPVKWKVENLWSCNPTTNCQDPKRIGTGTIEDTITEQIFNTAFTDINNPDFSEFTIPVKFEVLREKYFEEVAEEVPDLLLTV